MERLYHISEESSIERFDPRPSPSIVAGVTEPVVWAVDHGHIINYLLPRDCPRVTYYALEESKEEDIEMLMGPSISRHIVAIEDIWFERAMKQELWIYEFEPDTFSVVDEGAGYFVSKGTVEPVAKRRIENPLAELVSSGVELRVLSSLWNLRDAVIESSLQYSCIRMRNAKPRDTNAKTKAGGNAVSTSLPDQNSV